MVKLEKSDIIWVVYYAGVLLATILILLKTVGVHQLGSIKLSIRAALSPLWISVSALIIALSKDIINYFRGR